MSYDRFIVRYLLYTIRRKGQQVCFSEELETDLDIVARGRALINVLARKMASQQNRQQYDWGLRATSVRVRYIQG
jgi:hypothetical protein